MAQRDDQGPATGPSPRRARGPRPGARQASTDHGLRPRSRRAAHQAPHAVQVIGGGPGPPRWRTARRRRNAAAIHGPADPCSVTAMTGPRPGGPNCPRAPGFRVSQGHIRSPPSDLSIATSRHYLRPRLLGRALLPQVYAVLQRANASPFVDPPARNRSHPGVTAARKPHVGLTRLSRPIGARRPAAIPPRPARGRRGGPPTLRGQPGGSKWSSRRCWAGHDGRASTGRRPSIGTMILENRCGSVSRDEGQAGPAGALHRGAEHRGRRPTIA